MYKKWVMAFIIALVTFTVGNAEASSFPYKTLESTPLKVSASSKAKTIQTLKMNTNLSLISTQNGWANVQVGKTRGYVQLKSILPLEIPIKKHDSYHQVMTYKGTEIASVNGKSAKISSTLLPFFKQNAATLRSTLAKPIIQDNTIVGFERLALGQFAQVKNPIIIDRNAAARIQSLKLPGGPVTITTAAPLRQVILEGWGFEPYKQTSQWNVTLNGTIQQFHSNTRFTLRGKGTINRWDIHQAQLSYDLPITYNGEIGFLNVKHADVVLRGTSTFKVRAVAAPTKTHILDGPNGLLGVTKPNLVIQGKQMGADERAIATALQNVTVAKLTQLFKQMNIAHKSNHMNDYVKAFELNETAGPNKLFFTTKSDISFVVSAVDRTLEFNQFSEPFVALSNPSNRTQIQMKNIQYDSWAESIYHKRVVNALIGESGLITISFKGPEQPVSEFARLEKQGRYFIYNHPHGPGTFRVVAIDGKKINGFTYTIEMGRDSYDEHNHFNREELVRIGDKTLDSYNQAPPAFEVKVVKGLRGSNSYLAVRSNDNRWLKHAYGYTLQVNKHYQGGGRLSSDAVDLAGWDPKQTIILSQLDGKLNDTLTIKAFGYQDAKQK